jgi:hypothetical protein
MKYFQTDDRDDYFATLSKNKPLREKLLFNIMYEGKMILECVEGYKCITFTKTLVKKTRKDLSCGRWKLELIYLGYFLECTNSKHNQFLNLK